MSECSLWTSGVRVLVQVRVMHCSDVPSSGSTRGTVRKRRGGHTRNRKPNSRGITVRGTEKNRKLESDLGQGQVPGWLQKGAELLIPRHLKMSDTIFHHSSTTRFMVFDYMMILDMARSPDSCWILVC